MTEDEMVGWHHRIDGHESEQALGDGEGQAFLSKSDQTLAPALQGMYPTEWKTGPSSVQLLSRVRLFATP